jgi:hypothetical protein
LAYLYGKLRDNERIHITPLPGIRLNGLKPGQVLGLLLSIYGLKQAGRRWYAELRRVLGDIQPVHIKHDHAVFMCRYSDGTVSVIFVHVDDMLLITTTHAHKEDLKKKIKQVFEVTGGGGKLSWLLGIQIHSDKKGTHRLAVTVSRPGPGRTPEYAREGHIRPRRHWHVFVRTK